METGAHQEPSTAELARTALAQARAATLISRGRGASGDSMAVVKVEDSPDGRPLVQLERTSAMVRRLTACPVATISIATPAPFIALQLTGPAMPCKRAGEGLRGFRVSLLSARLVGWRKVVPVPLGDFRAASPDPFWPHAVEVLSTRAVPRPGAACLRACPRPAGGPGRRTSGDRPLRARARARRRHGFVGARLPVPGGPVESLAEVTCGVRALLTCRCGSTSTGAPPDGLAF